MVNMSCVYLASKAEHLVVAERTGILESDLGFNLGFQHKDHEHNITGVGIMAFWVKLPLFNAGIP